MIYENVLALCKKNHITIAKLEKEVGLGNATVRGWDKSSPTVERLRRVADYFGVTLDELVKEDGHAS